MENSFLDLISHSNSSNKNVSTHTPTICANWTHSWLAETQPDRVGQSCVLISIPIQAHKSACSLTWCCSQRQTRRGGQGPRMQRMARESSTWKPECRYKSSVTHLTETPHRSAHLPRSVRKRRTTTAKRCARETTALLLLPPDLNGGRGVWKCLWFSHPVLLSGGGSDPEHRVTHEARGRSQDGSLQEAVEGEEADRCGVHPAVPASFATHPPHQREYKQNEMPFVL